MLISSSILTRLYNRIYPGIRIRITFPFMLVTLLIGGVGAFVVSNLVAGSIQERFTNQLADSARAAQNIVVDIERQQLATLRIMVFTDGIPEAINEHDVNQLDDLIRPVAQNGDVDDVIVFDRRGDPILQLTRTEDNSVIEYRRSFSSELSDFQSVRRVISGEADRLGDKYVDIMGEPPDSIFYISAPVIDEANRLIGGISVGLSTDQLVRRISNQALSTIIIYDDQGVLLAETLRATDNSPLMMSQSDYRDIYTTVEDDSPIDEFEANGNPYQVMYVPFYLRSEHIGVMGVALPTNFLVEQTATGRTFLAGLFSVLFVMVIVVGILTARTITRPVSRLIDTTRAIREGDLSRRVQLRVPDELGELGLSFDHMTDELVSSYHRISTLYDTQVTETARREAVLASIGDPVIVLDNHGQTIFRNRAATQMIDQAKRATNWTQIIDRMLRQAPNLVDNPQRVYMGDNIFDVIATPVLIDKENTLGHVIVFRNLTAILRAEQMKDQLMAQMSHELRTPMTAVRGYVDLVRMIDIEKLSESGAEFLEKAVEGMSAMEMMLNQVVDVNAMMANRFNILPTEIDLVDIFPLQLEEWRPRLENKSQSFEIIVEANELQVLADPIYITQVVDHLMSNAWNYTRQQGSITAVLKREGDHAVLSVSDTGVGISEEEIGQIFDRMFRGEAAQAGDTDSRGLGLGLYISKNIVDAHHGTIDVQSERHVGTTATVKLPLQVV